MKAYVCLVMCTITPILPFALCIPLDLSPEVHYVSNYASPTIYPMHSIRLILRCTLCIRFASPTICPMHFIRTNLRSSFLSDVVLRLVVTDVRLC